MPGVVAVGEPAGVKANPAKKGAKAVNKETKNQRRRAAKKAKKEKERDKGKGDDKDKGGETETEKKGDGKDRSRSDGKVDDGGDDDYGMDLDVGVDLSADDPLYEQFKDVLEKFREPDGLSLGRGGSGAVKEKGEKPEVYFDGDDEIPDEDDEARAGDGDGADGADGALHGKMSKKARKQQNKLSVAELKALVREPEIVHWTDTDATDPRLLVAIKSHRNVVPVPSHWSLKREYLSTKRGIEKAAFALPRFIQETGIAEMRDAVLEKQAEASLKQKQRERVQPKMGKLDIDYQRLYEAFFRFQTKPELTRYGEVYYEGKEHETNIRHLRPGDLSEELKEALNIPPGAPPPWLINMQRFGPPPAYPALKIPGLNAPPPPGGQWGFHPGGYGKPPVDEFNRPLYGGDIFGILQAQTTQQLGEPVEKSLWGELQEPEDESEEEEDDEDEDEDDSDAGAGRAAGAEEDIGTGLQTPSGLETPGGIASTMTSEFGYGGGGESVAGGEFTLRKQRRGGTETDESTVQQQPQQARSAYTVLPEHSIRAQGFFGGERAYDLRGAGAGGGAAAAPQNNSNLPLLDQQDNDSRRKRKAAPGMAGTAGSGDLEVSVPADALERDDKLSKDEIKRRYEAQQKEEAGRRSMWSGGGGGGGGLSLIDQEDLSQMIADESRKRAKRDEEKAKRRGR